MNCLLKGSDFGVPTKQTTGKLIGNTTIVDSNIIQKYSKKTIPQLIKLATKHFNAYIRERDKPLGCISCGNPVQHAGHFYSAGHHSVHRFDEKNVNGQCLRCNNFLHGNLLKYRDGFLKKWGMEAYQFLEDHAHDKVKWDRWTLIHYIEKYRDKVRGD